MYVPYSKDSIIHLKYESVARSYLKIHTNILNIHIIMPSHSYNNALKEVNNLNLPQLDS